MCATLRFVKEFPFKRKNQFNVIRIGVISLRTYGSPVNDRYVKKYADRHCNVFDDDGNEYS